MKRALLDAGLESKSVEIVDAMLAYAGESKRAPGLFSGGGLMSQLGKTLHSSVIGVENVYTQHVPLLSQTIDSISKNKLNNSTFPLLTGSSSSKPTLVVVYMVGGVTMEEATKVSEFNAASSGMHVLLGGSSVQNSSSFMKEVGNAFR